MNLARRHAVPILLLAGWMTACASNPVSPPGSDVECNAAPDASRPQYIVGYGSLMEDESRKRTSPNAGIAHPVEVAGYRRGWFARGQPVGFSTTYLGVVPDRANHLTAVIYRVDPAELAATDRREISYCRMRVASADVKPLERESSAAPEGQTWIYVNRPRSVATPSAEYPIVQSYVDIFISGCLEQEERFGLAGFARECIATTTDWSAHWVNDRIHPRRPFADQPRAGQIDTLLSSELPDQFARIRIER